MLVTTQDHTDGCQITKMLTGEELIVFNLPVFFLGAHPQIFKNS